MKDERQYFSSSTVATFPAALEQLQAALDGTFGVPPAQLAPKKTPPSSRELSWVRDGSISRKDLIELAELAAEHGFSVKQDGRTIIPPKNTAPSALPGVTFTSYTRVGDEVRDRYLNHLGEMLSGGQLDQAEYEARSDLALKSKTREELDYLIQDLPAPPLPSKPVNEKAGAWSSWMTTLGYAATFLFFAGFSWTAVLSAAGLGIAISLAVAWGIITVLSIANIRKRA